MTLRQSYWRTIWNLEARKYSLLPRHANILCCRGSRTSATQRALQPSRYTVTRRHIYTTPSSHYTALRAMIPPLPLGRSESSWLHQNFIARASADVPNTLGEAPPPDNPDEADLHRQEWVHLAHLQCGHHLVLHSYEHCIRPEVDPACRWCGEDQETISHIFQECPQLAVEWADAGVSNPRDLLRAPAVALIFAGTIGLIPGLD